MLDQGALAVAVVHRQVMVVQAVRTHKCSERRLDVYIYQPFGGRVFIAPQMPTARISSKDLLTIFPVSDIVHITDRGMLELPQKAYSEFIELSSYNQRRMDNMWNQLQKRTTRR